MAFSTHPQKIATRVYERIEVKTMKSTVIAALLALAVLIVGGAHTARAQDATPTPVQEEAATPEPTLAEQLAAIAQIHPVPRVSDQPTGMTTVPCDPVLTRGIGDGVEGETFYCGVFTVPQNWDAPDGRNLELTFVVVKATGNDPTPDPLVFLAGGPGQSALLTSIAAYDQIRPTHDIVRLAQRGTAFGQRLGEEECLALAAQSEDTTAQVEQLLAATGEADTQDDAAVAEAAGQLDQLCWELFTEQDLDLDQFTTAASARDLVEFIKALGYEQYNLHGISYGSRLAMTIMQGVPGVQDAPALRSVVLDSTFPPSLYLLSSVPRSRHDPVMQMIADCAADDACQQAYPNLTRRLHDLLDRLAAAPLAVDGETVAQADLVNALVNLTGQRTAYMPKLIAELESGVIDTYLGLRDGALGVGDPEFGLGLDLSDPLQALIQKMLQIAVKEGGMDRAFEIVVLIGEAAAAEDPLAVLSEYIESGYEGGAREEMLSALAEVTPEEADASPLVIEARNAQDAEPPTAEEVAAQEEVQARILSLSGVAHYLNQNIHCNEDYQFERFEDAVNTYNDLEFPALSNMEMASGAASTCDLWPVAAAPIAVKNPISSTVPTLILQGTADTATPPFMGRRAARELANSTLVMIPQHGHEVWKGATSCAGTIATAFVLDPEQELDLSCLEARLPQWALPKE